MSWFLLTGIAAALAVPWVLYWRLTSQVRLERALRAAEQARDQRDLRQLLEDIRGPLCAILGYGALLKDSIPAPRLASLYGERIQSAAGGALRRLDASSASTAPIARSEGTGSGLESSQGVAKKLAHR